MTHFLPVTMQELLETGVSQPDFVYITGDAYVDHPSFGAAIITGCWNPRATASLSSPSPTGTPSGTFSVSASRDWRFW